MKKIIKTEKQYDNAMARHLELMMADPRPGTEDFDELELLTLLIQTYESEHVQIPSPSPVDAIRFRMEQQGLKQKDLIPYIGNKSQVSEILRGKRPLTLTMARNLHKGLGIPAEILLQDPEKELTEEFDPKDYPVREMQKLGWFSKFANQPWTDVRAHAGEMLQNLFGPFSKQQFIAYNRAGFKPDEELDDNALHAWRCKTLLDSEQQKLPEFRAETLSPEFFDFLARVSQLQNGPKLAIEQIKDRGVAVVINRHLPKTYLDGAALLNRHGRPVVGLTLRHDRLDNFWFTLFHELAHVKLHLTHGHTKPFFDNTESGDNSGQEKEANDYALDALISQELWKEVRNLTRAPEVRAAAKKLAIHPAILAGRIRRESHSYSTLPTLVGQGEVRKLLME